ncbi:RNA polymerase sigma factor [Hamadaea tsunoensis]|uniref:RNA polymerase sigma factor n=1 Tax=Hamadaea tsunoensis TaxID=53368 RepID=UPI0012FA9F09|nr:hypothetical protein [Hamadaea tsunoensis]
MTMFQAPRDEAWYRAVDDRHRDRLVRRAAFLLGPDLDDLAEDVVNAVMAKLVLRRHVVPNDPAAWLQTAVRREVSTTRRAQRRHIGRIKRLLRLRRGPVEQPSEPGRLSFDEHAAAKLYGPAGEFLELMVVRKTIIAVDRDIIWLHVIDDLPHDQICELLHDKYPGTAVNPGNVATRMDRALRRIKKACDAEPSLLEMLGGA